MTTDTRDPGFAATMALGVLLAVATWLAGTGELAFVGFVTAAVVREAARSGRWRP